MNAYEQHQYAHIITDSFTQTEIEHLEDFADYGFGKIEKNPGGTWEFDPNVPLLLDQIQRNEEIMDGEDDA